MRERECLFCGATFERLKTKASQCPGCGVVYPAVPPGGKSTDALDRAWVQMAEDDEAGYHPIALLDAAASDWPRPAKPWETRPDTAPKLTGEAEAEGLAASLKRQSWIRWVARGRTGLMRWRDRTAEWLANHPNEDPPGVPLWVGEYVGQPVPTSHWQKLQKLLPAGKRIEDVPVRRNPPGRPHPHRESDWERYKASLTGHRCRRRVPVNVSPPPAFSRYFAKAKPKTSVNLKATRTLKDIPSTIGRTASHRGVFIVSWVRRSHSAKTCSNVAATSPG